MWQSHHILWVSLQHYCQMRCIFDALGYVHSLFFMHVMYSSAFWLNVVVLLLLHVVFAVAVA